VLVPNYKQKANANLQLTDALGALLVQQPQQIAQLIQLKQVVIKSMVVLGMELLVEHSPIALVTLSPMDKNAMLKLLNVLQEQLMEQTLLVLNKLSLIVQQ
jgi:RecA/RadA recombinase